MKLHRYVDHQRLHIVTKGVISLSISVLLLFRHYISHKITFGAPSSGGVLRSACGAFIFWSYGPIRPHTSVFPGGDYRFAINQTVPHTNDAPSLKLNSLYGNFMKLGHMVY